MPGNKPRCGGAISSGGPSRQPCHFFQAHGRCKFGDGCRFSHDTSQVLANRSNPPPNPRGKREGEGKLREWKRILDQGSQRARPSSVAVSRFFQLGLELMDGDVGGAQEAIKLLAKETGLSFIKDVTDRHISLPQAATNTTLWTTEIEPLFHLITHPLVVDSAILEQQVATIFNFLYGVGGDRMTRLFVYIIQLLKSSPGASLPRMAVVELTIDVLSKLMDCNTSNIVNTKFSALATGLSEWLKTPSTQPEEEFSRLQASKYLDYIQLRLSVGDEIAVLTSRPQQANATREQFKLRRDLPGQLCAEGPRHDNDHAEITDIKILPTYKEIFSTQAEYLPTTDPSQWHLKGIRGRLDREFRLLREDTVGQLRDAVRETLEAIRKPHDSGTRRTPKNGARTYTYDFPVPENVALDRQNGLEMLIRCQQPPAVRNLSAKKRKEWWMQSKRLQAGALVCVLNAAGSVLFCVVSNSTLRSTDDKQARPMRGLSPEQLADRRRLNLSEDDHFLFVRLQLVEPKAAEIGRALRWYQDIGGSARRYLVEFPGILLASFNDTLAALQKMYRNPDVPFGQLIAPSGDGAVQATVERPQYANKAGFAFDLGCLTTGKQPFLARPGKLPTPQDVAARTSLDPTQSSALLNTLSRGLSLIQGPPGTGKSYTGERIIKVLLANTKAAKLGPILCVCYTNHALDQLLEHLLDDNIGGIIRIGSRSQSERLQDLNLRTVARAITQTKSEKHNMYVTGRSIDESVEEAESLLQNLSSSTSWTVIKEHLNHEYPSHHLELFPVGEDGWETVNYSPERNIDKWLSGGYGFERPSRPLEVLEEAPLSDMTRDERRLLYHHWTKTIRDGAISKIISVHLEYTQLTDQRARLRRDVDLRGLQQAQVVGVTTTGLARNLDLLRRLRCKVMLCEEAGEVLEAHILTALLPSVEHAILIGDHLQLRPQIQNYDLQSTNPRGAQYSLDMSLFERLVAPPDAADARIPFSMLETQRRMHPSIADLIRRTLYPSLQDADRVSKYPEVMGMRKRLFWLQHEQPEAGVASSDPLSTSHSNEFEVEMTTALVSHLVRQGEYSKADIAVITPYLGQLQRLRRKMESMFEICLNERDQEDVEALEAFGTDASANTPAAGPRANLGKKTLLKSIRVATVDNFQGEEAKVVVICLVRSNPQNNCGFLRTSNRINVLLSRAQHGMYIIGNANTYRSVPMWDDVIRRLQAGGNFGTSLELQCPRHPKTPIAVSQPDHFLAFSPESGCSLKCEKRLLCGHSCPGRCHADILHDSVKCLEDCPRPKKGCDHPCPLRCGDPCHAKCQTLLEDISLELPCGHLVSSARCWEAQNPASILCTRQVTRVVPGCKHMVKALCPVDVSLPTYTCTAKCDHILGCGHKCQRQCSLCNPRQPEDGTIAKGRVDHGTCKTICGRTYTACPHACRALCHDGTPCPPCNEPCEVRCGHSRCSKRCHEPCTPCAEQHCHSTCTHAQCTMPCAAPCNWVPCSKRCEILLSCGHQCPSICGEVCPEPEYCQECAAPHIKSRCVDFLEMKEYHEIDLDEEPCVFPSCRHFLTVSSMDGQMNMGDYYALDANGMPISILGASEPFSHDVDEDNQIKKTRTCPTCRGSLRSISRYGRIIRRGMLDEATKRFMSWSNMKYIDLAKMLLDEEEKMLEIPFEPPTPAADGTAESKSAAAVSGQLKKLRFMIPRRRNLECLDQLTVGDSTPTKKQGRYAGLIGVWSKINTFASQVSKEEQPFQRVADLVRHANRYTNNNNNRTNGQAHFQYDESVIQVKGHLLALSLLLQCETTILSDVIRLHREGELPGLQQALEKLEWGLYFAECDTVIKLAAATQCRKDEVQGHIYAAQMSAFARASPVTKEDEEEGYTKLAQAHLDRATELLAKYPSAAKLADEVKRVQAVIDAKDGAIFYREVTSDEMRAVYAAMAQEFRGTGHWYRCANGHPFTIGDCGLPRQLARCPECNAPVGGQNYTEAEGVRRADDIEQLARGVDQLRV